MKRSRLVALAVVLAAVFACNRPSSREYFVRSGSVSDSVYRFSIDLFDTLTAFDLSFFTAVDNISVADTVPGGFPLEILWINPAGDSLRETVYMPYGNPSGYKVPYRSGVVASVAGEHLLEVKIPSPPEGLRGLGIICHR